MSASELAVLTRTQRLSRLGVVAVILGSACGLFAYAGGWLTPHALSPASITNTFEELNGKQAGFRRNHAKGLGFSGYFESNGRGVELSRSVFFGAGRWPVLGRFALGGGQPYAADGARTVRSMALSFQLPNGEEWRMGMNNIPVFPVRDPSGFRELLVASAPDKATGKPDPAKLAQFRAQHPESADAMALIGTAPVSSGFDDATYRSLNAFRFTSAQGVEHAVRWAMVPLQAFAEPKKPWPSDKNYLFDSLIESVRRGPLRWSLVVTIAEAADPTNDATKPWPAERRQLEVGTLTVERVEGEATSPARDINFDPLILPDGVKGSDDPLLSARSAVYARSFERREGEAKQPSAVEVRP